VEKWKIRPFVKSWPRIFHIGTSHTRQRRGRYNSCKFWWKRFNGASSKVCEI